MTYWFLNFIGWGDIYDLSWWGGVNELNNWGIIYPFDAKASKITVDSILERASNFFLTADKTKY